MADVTLQDIQDIALTLQDKLNKLEALLTQSPNARVLSDPKQVNDTLSKVNVRFDPQIEGFTFGNLLCKIKDQSLMNVKVGDELYFTGKPSVREYNGKKYCDVWLHSFKVITSGASKPQQQTFPTDEEDF